MADLGDPVLMLVLWIVGGLIALSGALCYGEVGAAIPDAGGEYAFLSKLYHPILGFLSGWVSFIVGFSAPIAASAIGFSEYLYHGAPYLLDWSSLETGVTKKICSALIIAVFTAIHLRGVELGAKVQNVLTILKVGLIVVFLLAGFSWGTGAWDNLSQDSLVAINFGGWKVMALSLMWIMFAYSGWNASTYIGSEIINPLKNIPRSLLYGTFTVMLLYFLLNLLFVYAIPPEEMKGVIAVGALAMGNLFGRTMENVFSLMISLALFSSISEFIILGPRVYFAMAKDGYFFRFASIVSKHKVPIYSVIFQGVISIILILTGTLDQIFTFMGFSLSIFPLLVVIGSIKLRRSGKSVLKLPGYPYTTFFYLAIGTGMLILAYFERPIESSIAVATVFAGIPAYYIFKKFN
jgi:APA family basic amino acid/polyamine antiporter